MACGCKWWDQLHQRTRVSVCVALMHGGQGRWQHRRWRRPLLRHSSGRIVTQHGDRGDRGGRGNRGVGEWRVKGRLAWSLPLCRAVCTYGQRGHGGRGGKASEARLDRVGHVERVQTHVTGLGIVHSVQVDSVHRLPVLCGRVQDRPGHTPNNITSRPPERRAQPARDNTFVSFQAPQQSAATEETYNNTWGSAGWHWHGHAHVPKLAAKDDVFRQVPTLHKDAVVHDGVDTLEGNKHARTKFFESFGCQAFKRSSLDLVLHNPQVLEHRGGLVVHATPPTGGERVPDDRKEYHTTVCARVRFHLRTGVPSGSTGGQQHCKTHHRSRQCHGT